MQRKKVIEIKEVTKKETKSMKETHYSIPTWKIKSIKSIGDKYKTQFNDSPFDNSEEEGYFEIDQLKDTPKWKKFIEEIEALKVHYEYAFKNGEGKKIYMPIQIWEKREISNAK